MSEPQSRPSISTALVYKDPRAALIWLEEAFGFESAMVIFDAEDRVAHAEMRFGEGLIMVGSEWSDRHRSPMALDGVNTQSLHVHLGAGDGGLVDAHCERARRAGAHILSPPADQFYGDRSYRAVDPEGHVWSFAVTVKDVPFGSWDADMGFKTRTSL